MPPVACTRAGFCSDEDSLVLEDEGARMSMRSDCAELQPRRVVTGARPATAPLQPLLLSTPADALMG